MESWRYSSSDVSMRYSGAMRANRGAVNAKTHVTNSARQSRTAPSQEANDGSERPCQKSSTSRSSFTRDASCHATVGIRRTLSHRPFGNVYGSLRKGLVSLRRPFHGLEHEAHVVAASHLLGRGLGHDRQRLVAAFS